MKLQHLIIIFLIIALPIIIVLSFYVGMQLDTVSMKIKYDNYLSKAAQDAVVAFELNTTNNAYASLNDAKIRDIEASVNVFSSSLATSLGVSAANPSRMMAYVPALVFSLYDGYYVYSPKEREWNATEQRWENINLGHDLKPYVYYTKTYELNNRILTINYSLDNYVSVYYSDGTNYTSRAGYLEPEATRPENITDTNANRYYNDAIDFTHWFNDVVSHFNGLAYNNEYSISDCLTITRNNLALPNADSLFNSVKHDVIKESIISNLLPAMQIYGYEMPRLTDEDWDLLLNNVCVIAFMQDVPAGTSTFNSYTIAVSSENNEKINESDLYYINVNNTDNKPINSGSYHRIWCEHLDMGDDKGVRGYKKNELEKNDDLKNIPPCYYCVVKASDSSLEFAERYEQRLNSIQKNKYNLSKRRVAYYETLANKKLALTKYSEFINDNI